MSLATSVETLVLPADKLGDIRRNRDAAAKAASTAAAAPLVLTLRQIVTLSSRSVTSAAIGERSERVSVTCANSG